MAQFAHTFVAVAANGKFSVSCKTLKDAQCIKRLLITSTEVSQADFRKGVTIIKQDTHIIVDGLPNDYLWAHPYVVFEQRGFKFDFEDLPAAYVNQTEITFPNPQAIDRHFTCYFQTTGVSQVDITFWIES